MTSRKTMPAPAGWAPLVPETKLSPPPRRAETIARGPLVDRVRGAKTRLTVITGPAGSGKSTLMAECHRADPSGVWVSLDDADNDPVVFWGTVILGLSRLIPGFGSAYRDRLAAGGPAAVEPVVTLAVNELIDRRTSVRLYLDDLQLVDSQNSLRSLDTFVDQLPGTVSIVVASRGAPALSLARRRVARDATEIGGADLAMSATEARSLLDSLGVRLGRDYHLDELLAHTEGWPAGLHLVGMAMRRRGTDLASRARAVRGSDRPIADYLISEVLRNLPANERQFLLETSVLRNLSAEVCDAVTGRSDSADLLEALERKNAFVIALDTDGSWYRYHHMFAELLVSQLHRHRRGKVRELHLRAFDWLRRNGAVADAIDHALAAGLVDEAADLFCETWLELMNDGRLATARALVDRFEPAEISQRQPMAIAAAHVCGLSGDHRNARRLLRVAEAGRYTGAPKDGAASMASSLAITRGSLALEGIKQALADAEMAYELESPSSPWRPLASLIIGLARVMSGDRPGATAYFEEASLADHVGIRAYAVAELSLGELTRGRQRAAADAADEACGLVEVAGLCDVVIAGAAYAAAALARIDLGEEDAARERLMQASRAIGRLGLAMPADGMHVCLLLAEAALKLGEYSIAEDALERARSFGEVIGDTGVMDAQLADLRAQLSHRSGPGTETGLDEGLVFTKRERDILELLPSGLTTRQIAAELFVSRNTVKTHQHRIYRKLDVSSRAGAIARAHLLGILEADSARPAGAAAARG